MPRKLTYWGNDREIKRKASIISLILLMVGGGLIAAVPSTSTSSTVMAQQTPATTETVSIENTTDTEATTQDDEAVADEETQQSTTGEVGQESPSSSTENQSEPTTLRAANNTNATAVTTANATNATNTTDVGLDGRMVFARSQLSDLPDTAEIYVMNADGSGGQTGLTNNTAGNFEPTWSPDGTKIAFASGSGDIDPEIYIMNADGSDVTQLTNNNGYDASPSWSPDGERIAFVSDRAFQVPPTSDRNYEIYVMNVDEGTLPPVSRPQQIIEQAISTIENLDNIPQGLRTSIIVLLRQVLGMINNDTTDGTGTVTPPQQEPIRLTNNNASDGSPSWSPDGEKIAFSSDRGSDPFDPNSDIYVMNADDGSEQTRLTEDSQFDGNPRWSPDGEKIAFYSNRGVGGGIYVMNADDGSNVTRLTEGEHPAWSPDGEKIAFSSDRDAEVDSDKNAIYVMNSTGADNSSNATRLTEPDWYYASLDWSSSASTPGGGSNATNNTRGVGNNQTGNQTGGGETPSPLTVNAVYDTDEPDPPNSMYFEASVNGGTDPYACQWDFGDGTTSDACSQLHIYENDGVYNATITVTDATGQTASDSTGPVIRIGDVGIPPNEPPTIYGVDDRTEQATSPEGAPVFFQVNSVEYVEGEIYDVPVSCDHESGETFPIGETVVTCTAVGREWADGQQHTTQESFTITVVEEEEPTGAADDGEAELPAADGEVAEPPTNSTGGQ